MQRIMFHPQETIACNSYTGKEHTVFLRSSITISLLTSRMKIVQIERFRGASKIQAHNKMEMKIAKVSHQQRPSQLLPHSVMRIQSPWLVLARASCQASFHSYNLKHTSAIAYRSLHGSYLFQHTIQLRKIMARINQLVLCVMAPIIA